MSNFITNLLLIKDQNITMEDKPDLINVNVNLNMSKKFKIKMYILFICLLEKIFKSIRISSYFSYM